MIVHGELIPHQSTTIVPFDDKATILRIKRQTARRGHAGGSLWIIPVLLFALLLVTAAVGVILDTVYGRRDIADAVSFAVLFLAVVPATIFVCARIAMERV